MDHRGALLALMLFTSCGKSSARLPSEGQPAAAPLVESMLPMEKRAELNRSLDDQRAAARDREAQFDELIDQGR